MLKIKRNQIPWHLTTRLFFPPFSHETSMVKYYHLPPSCCRWGYVICLELKAIIESHWIVITKQQEEPNNNNKQSAHTKFAYRQSYVFLQIFTIIRWRNTRYDQSLEISLTIFCFSLPKQRSWKSFQMTWELSPSDPGLDPFSLSPSSTSGAKMGLTNRFGFCDGNDFIVFFPSSSSHNFNFTRNGK